MDKAASAGGMTPDWLLPAVDYVERWLRHQLRTTRVPGCVIAVAHQGVIIAERALGIADVSTGEPMTSSHLFRVASHSKTFTAVGILKLCEQGRIDLDEAIGRYVPDLAPELFEVTARQLLSHGSGLMRDGLDAPHWQLRAPFFDAFRLGEELAQPQTFPVNEQFKYSNLGFALVGRVIESVTGERYQDWMSREVVAAAGLKQTAPDLPSNEVSHLAAGHSGILPHGERRVIDSWRPTYAMAPATGFTSTARDLAIFFAGLNPDAPSNVLSARSRAAMTGRLWSVPHRVDPRWYGLGTFHGSVHGHEWYGHWGSWPGFITRTSHVPDWDVTISILTNAIDGPANQWGDAAIGILHAFSRRGSPIDLVRDWQGRWWTIWTPLDFVPVGNRVLLADPSSLAPLAYANELTVFSSTEAKVSLADGVAHPGERVLRTLDDVGRPVQIQLGGNRLVPEWVLAAELGGYP